ncbi:MAG: hypothetical protein ACNA8P_11115, partial [Phycisphaerales bacterium]
MTVHTATPDAVPAAPPARRLLGLFGVVVLSTMGLLLGGCSGSQAHSYTLNMPAGLQRLAVDVENYRGHVEVISDSRARAITVDGWVWLS